MVAVDNCAQNVILGRKELVKNLFKSKIHRFNDNRLNIILWWTDANNTSVSSTFEAKFNYLEKAWENCNFRPFDDIKSSENHLASNLYQDFLIRLSSSQPGGITFTFRSTKTISSSIIHTRFFVNKNSKIIDSNGGEHETIDSLAKWFSYHRYRSQTANAAGYICYSG